MAHEVIEIKELKGLKGCSPLTQVSVIQVGPWAAWHKPCGVSLVV